MNGDVAWRMFAECGGSHEADAAVDRQTDDDCQVGDCAADGDRYRLDHVAVVLQRRRFTGQQPLPHVCTYTTHAHTCMNTASRIA